MKTEPARRAVGLGFAIALSILAILVPGLARGHGASRGLHLHVSPEPARPGGRVTVRIDAAAPLLEVRISFVDGQPKIVRPRAPRRRLRTRLRVPAEAEGETVPLHAEGRDETGEIVRASAVLRLTPGDDDRGAERAVPATSQRLPNMAAE